MKKRKFSQARREASERYRKKNSDKIRKQNTERRQKARMEKRFIAAQKVDMEKKFEELKPVLFKWASYYAFWNNGFEIHELVNVAFAHGGFRRIKNPKFLAKKARWIMKDYMRKVRRDNSIDKLVQMYVKRYGRQPDHVGEKPNHDS